MRCDWLSPTRESPAATFVALALDTTGSTVIPVGEGLVPLDDYYLWADHRAQSMKPR